MQTAVEAKPLQLLPADQSPPTESRITIVEEQDARRIDANAIPEHLVGRFPNHGNPNAIRAQHYRFNLPLDPQPAQETTPLHSATRPGPPNMPFGVALNGVLFDPGTAGFWRGERALDWNYEALSGAVELGLDAHVAHVQPGGQYHYHGLPVGLLRKLGHSPEKHSPLVGWAADGFPIYAQYGYAEHDNAQSAIVELHSSYRLKSGNRPGGENAPGGAYDGTFVQDYEFVPGVGKLDECNGRTCLTPDFPAGTYAYFLTTDWPVVPRNFRGKPVRLR
ncbi:YHYH protein [Botrimarina hoheduenensis]|nr:YHYH protein [Botrimarina hoheduenensis]